MPDFWAGCGYRLLSKASDGRLAVTDDYLRAYFERPELALVPESCPAEERLHARLTASPRSAVEASEIEGIADADARENYRVMLRFRDQLVAAPTLEAFYFDLFRRDVAVPPQFVHDTTQVILRSLLEGVENGLELRAAEIFFRPQRVTVERGAVMLADAEVVERYSGDAGLGNVGRLLRELNAPVRSAELDVLDEANHAEYFRRDERYDLVLQVNPGGAGATALARVLERWIAHFHGIAARVTPIREIPDEDWRWHVGLDAEATAMLNDIYNGRDVDEDRMKRIIGLFRLEFTDAAAVRSDLQGAPVFLGLAMTPEGELRMKPQNLLMNLPLARRT